MNLILIICIFACLPDASEGFIATQLKVSISHRRLSLLSCVSLEKETARGGSDKILSALQSVRNSRRSLKNVIQKLTNVLRPKFSAYGNKDAGSVCEYSVDSNTENIRAQSAVPRSSIDSVNDSISKMKAKVLTEKIRLLPAFFIVNILSIWRFVRPCIASGERYACDHTI